MLFLSYFFYVKCYRQGANQALFDDVYVIFPIHVNFPITSMCVLKAIHKKNGELFYVTWESFFSKRRFYDIEHACCIWLILPFYHDLFPFFMFLYLTFINYFCGTKIYTRVFFFSIFVRDLFFSNFPLIF